ncbi:hypothetical protein [Paenibacillus sp. NEAU-GSW1]|uniref:hypothetical protein n=1 Tax=Paenibacillus sp. NEAU-GSW1 TaxID=2682486 RepID=UPI0012E0D4CF|nr:hypothetical protein [Paenibacillus sp. NEAU-GSW1]MUT68744.1 hypothetical protein [Paenibacillus sp. NEAU-GSW1]
MREGLRNKGKLNQDEQWELQEHGHHHHHHPHHKSAQTFRRGRAVAFLEKLKGNQATLQRQLNDPAFDAIKSVISGELKATESIMDAFIQMFQLHDHTADEISADLRSGKGGENKGSEQS